MLCRPQRSRRAKGAHLGRWPSPFRARARGPRFVEEPVLIVSLKPPPTVAPVSPASAVRRRRQRGCETDVRLRARGSKPDASSRRLDPRPVAAAVLILRGYGG